MRAELVDKLPSLFLKICRAGKRTGGGVGGYGVRACACGREEDAVRWK